MNSNITDALIFMVGILVCIFTILKVYRLRKFAEEKFSDLGDNAYRVHQPNMLWVSVLMTGIQMPLVLSSLSQSYSSSIDIFSTVLISMFLTALTSTVTLIASNQIVVVGDTVTVYRMIRNDFSFNFGEVRHIYNMRSKNGSYQTFVYTDSNKLFYFINNSQKSYKNSQRFYLDITASFADDELSPKARELKSRLETKRANNELS